MKILCSLLSFQSILFLLFFGGKGGGGLSLADSRIPVCLIFVHRYYRLDIFILFISINFVCFFHWQVCFF